MDDPLDEMLPVDLEPTDAPADDPPADWDPAAHDDHDRQDVEVTREEEPS